MNQYSKYISFGDTHKTNQTVTVGKKDYAEATWHKAAAAGFDAPPPAAWHTTPALVQRVLERQRRGKLPPGEYRNENDECRYEHTFPSCLDLLGDPPEQLAKKRLMDLHELSERFVGDGVLFPRPPHHLFPAHPLSAVELVHVLDIGNYLKQDTRLLRLWEIEPLADLSQYLTETVRLCEGGGCSRMPNLQKEDKRRLVDHIGTTGLSSATSDNSALRNCVSYRVR